MREERSEEDYLTKILPAAMVSRKFLAIVVIVVAVGQCHGQVGTAEEFQHRASAENGTEASFGERLRPKPASATIHEIHAELNRTTDRAQVSETSQEQRQVDNRRTSEPLEGHSSDLLASIFGEPSELEISGLHLPAEAVGHQRRFDDATLAMASTGQVRGNKFLIPGGAQMGANSRLMLKQQQLLAALDPLDASDPYFRDPVSPVAAPGGPLSGEQSQAVRSSGPGQQNYGRLAARRRAGGSRPQPYQQPRASGEADDEEEGDYSKGAKFAEGDDIFKDENEPVSRQKSGSVERSLQTDESSSEAEGDEDDEDDASGELEEASGAQVRRSKHLARSGSTLSLDKMGSQRWPTRRPGESSRRPLKGIEDSAQVLDERLDASNVEPSKRRPEVELVLRSYQRRAGAGGRRLELEAEEATSADSQQLVEKSGVGDLQAAAGHHHGHHGHHHHYYQYAGVPKKKAWKMGFKRGNHKHEISRHEKGYKNKFHSTFKWHAKEKCKKKKKCHSVGKMSWHYEHHDKKKKKHHY